MINRRQLFRGAATVAGGALMARLMPIKASAQTNAANISNGQTNVSTATDQTGYRPVITPNGETLPWKMVDGVKVFHLIAEPVTHEFTPGLQAECWGYNGRVHGPTIEAVEGDRVRIYVTNKLKAATTAHWHGLFLPNGMDGVGGMTQKPIQPGETFKYEFTLRQHGTFMYHSHHDEMTQMALGLMGMIVIHPKRIKTPVDHDFAIMLSEWRIDVGARRPDPNEMTDFNVLTMNARCSPGTAPLVVKRGSRVRIRFGNLSAMEHHPIHLHGHSFFVTETEGGEIPASARQPESTVLVGVGQTRTVEFVADAPGDWAMHCHMTHHAMNQMGHGFGNVIGMNLDGFTQKIRKLVPGYMAMGADGMGEMSDMGMAAPKNSIAMAGTPGQFDMITMGGMFNMLKVREEAPVNNADPGWYQNPAGTVADVALEGDLRRDGIVNI
jgi:FtsP/CotA-like multicopper oxidase with cupredoxin domain